MFLGAIMFTSIFLTSLPMYGLIKIGQQEKLREYSAEELKVIKKEQQDPKYNLRRQKEIVELTNGRQKEFREILGKEEYNQIIHLYHNSEIKYLDYAFIEAVAKNEGWEIYYHPVLKSTIYYYGAHVPVEKIFNS